MIRIPLRDLRVAFSNPAQYVSTYRPGVKRSGPSKYSMLLFAIGVFHQTNDVKQAQKYLEKKIVTNFKNVSDLPDYIQQLLVYTSEFSGLGNTFIRVRDRIVIPVLSRFAGIAVSGQAARVDLVPSGGYAGWVFVRGAPDWKDDPRMPLLQFAYSQKLAVDLGEVTVGTYDFKAGRHFSTRYSQAQVDTANKNLQNLLKLFQKKP